MNTTTPPAGSVNFDSNIIPESEQQRSQAVEAAADAASDTDVTVGLGNVRVLGADDVTAATATPVARQMVHSLTFELNLTLNNGFPFLAKSKALRSIEIERGGETSRFNFYNPFMRADKDRNTGEGLLRQVFGSIARLGHEVLGREAVFIGNDSDLKDMVANLSASVEKRMRNMFPLPPDTALFPIILETASGEVQRDVTFNEVFALDTWVTSSEDEESGLVYHIVHVNIGMNIGALYDSAEPHAFVQRAHAFLESQLKHLEIADFISYHVNYSIPASELNSDVVRTAFDVLLSEGGYTVVSKAGVLGSKYSWIPSEAADKLFGYDCDLILRSPVSLTADDEEDAGE